LIISVEPDQHVLLMKFYTIPYSVSKILQRSHVNECTGLVGKKDESPTFIWLVTGQDKMSMSHSAARNNAILVSKQVVLEN
jgi:hypothetical protein